MCPNEGCLREVRPAEVLCETNLRGVDLSGATLNGADFNGALADGTDLAGVEFEKSSPILRGTLVPS